ncbi:hypothetical protein [Glycomyces dulcitolivorans]|uniref:hypothetical protein n=1 Tax=Glycomyces dulcitolivorans TaxID=2200759 RepID=UPI0013002702|nr:hypothetical protein [Glycomyces dulcitolivorans]
MKVRAALCCLVVSVLLLSGCGGDDGGDPDADPTTGEVDAAAFDPPMRFDTSAGVALPAEASAGKISLGGNNFLALPVALAGTKAFVASVDRLQIIDTRSGEQFPDITPDSGTAMDPTSAIFVGDNPIQAPITVQLDGTDLVVVPFVVYGEAEGTEPAHQILELVAVDAASGERAFNVPVELPNLEGTAEYEFAEALGESGGVVVVDVDQKYTVMVDLDARAPAWEEAFMAEAVVGDTVVGKPLDAAGSLNVDGLRDGLAVADGAPTWEGEDFGLRELYAAGPKFVAAAGPDSADAGGLLWIDAASGAVAGQEAGNWVGYECAFDHAETVVCFNQSNRWTGAWDAETGERLWELADSDERSGVVFTAAWHGAVYGIGPVVLDARTGADAETEPGTAPHVVNEYIGIGEKESGGVAAYPSIE